MINKPCKGKDDGDNKNKVIEFCFSAVQPDVEPGNDRQTQDKIGERGVTHDKDLLPHNEVPEEADEDHLSSNRGQCSAFECSHGRLAR